jgi:hypothetical protein
MNHYPVHYLVAKPGTFTRVQLALRVAVFIVIGLVGLSVSLLLLLAYVGFAAFAALRLGGGGNAQDLYLEDDRPRILRALTWLGAVFAWLGLVTDRLPQRAPEELVRIEIDREARPTELTSASALWRLLTGLPSALVLALLYVVGAFVWLWSALRILVEERVGDTAHAYLTGVQRWTIRLLAYQASLIDEYPPFDFGEEPPRAELDQHREPQPG